MYGSRRPSLRVACRIMLGIWLVLVLCMSIVVGKTTKTETAGNLLAFLFTSRTHMQQIPVARLPATMPAEPEPSARPAPEPAPAPSPWTPFTQGTAPAEGTVGEPKVTVLADGKVEVILPYTGTPGQCKTFVPHAGIPALSTDFYGKWKKTPYLNQSLAGNSVLSRIQVAGHDGLFRVSGTGHRSGRPLKSESHYSSESIRIVFSCRGES